MTAIWSRDARRGWALRTAGALVAACAGALAAAAPASPATPARTDPSVRIDPVTRYVHVTYRVPAGAPDAVVVRCEWAAAGTEAWRPARVLPSISETGIRLAREPEWRQWQEEGRLIERRAAGLDRTLILCPYPEAERDGRVDIMLRIRVLTEGGDQLSAATMPVRADNRDVVTIEDWSRVMQRGAVAHGGEPTPGQWVYRTGLKPTDRVSRGDALYGPAGGRPLPQLTVPLDLRGWYALFVVTSPDVGDIRLRLSGDDWADHPASRKSGEEVLWRWARMDHQNLIVRQPTDYTGPGLAQIDYVRMVPLTAAMVAQLEAPYRTRPDRLLAGYFEPYSWAFYQDVHDNLQLREPLTMFAEARVGIVDVQVARFGAKVVYETRKTDPLIYSTQGDPIGDVMDPRSDNVGRMQQYTNTLQSCLRFARELGMAAQANFGASACYVGSPLQGDVTKRHPQWLRDDALRFEVPEARAYALSLVREALEIGAPGVSIDFCRYPECIDRAETGVTFMRELRAIANEFAQARRARVPIIVRFPAFGVRLADRFDFRTWAREGLVDYLAPGNLQGVTMHFDVAPYQKAVRGTRCVLLPAMDGLEWTPELPGPFLWRVNQLYAAGVRGIYLYQADGRILSRPEDRRCIRMMSSSAAVRDFWKRDASERPHRSKGIYLSWSSRPEGYSYWERLRLWVEGVPMGPMETYLDGKLVQSMAGPPYLLGQEDRTRDYVVPAGEHALRVRVRDGEGWLEQTFAIRGAP